MGFILKNDLSDLLLRITLQEFRDKKIRGIVNLLSFKIIDFQRVDFTHFSSRDFKEVEFKLIKNSKFKNML